MKVLVLTNMYPTPDMPFFGTFVNEQVESLRKQGVEVDVFFVNGNKSALNSAATFSWQEETRTLREENSREVVW